MHASSRRLSARLVAGACCLATVACAAVTRFPSPAGAAPRPRRAFPVSVPARRTVTGTPELAYFGGRILSKVKVDVVVWSSWSYGRTVPITGPHSISSFFAGITASRYVDWLSEYDTPSQHIGRGTLDGVYTVHPPTGDNGSTVTGTQIAADLRTMIDGGQLPKPNANRLYVIFFRSGQTIATPDGNSAADFCAYHETMAYRSTTAYYAVIPYELRNQGCRPTAKSFDNVTTIASHELVEGITDPGVGLSRVAWYDVDNGEIADICAGISSPAPVVGADGVSYVVQRVWSNRARACIVQR